jgi:MFS transporter, MCT family, solute carrier family 16 (monocarboxylic acid transporters), member 14
MGGIGFCFIYMPSVIIVGYYFEKWRPLATGIALCGSGVGTFILAPISTNLIELYGWKNTLLMQAGEKLHFEVCALTYFENSISYDSFVRNFRFGLSSN